MVTHLFSHASNHWPIILHARTALRCRGKSTRSFRFEEAWLMIVNMLFRRHGAIRVIMWNRV